MPQEAQVLVDNYAPKPKRARRHADASMRIVLVRHGRPAIETNPRTCHEGFRDYIDAYEAAGLDPSAASTRPLRRAPRGDHASTETLLHGFNQPHYGEPGATLIPSLEADCSEPCRWRSAAGSPLERDSARRNSLAPSPQNRAPCRRTAAWRACRQRSPP